MTGGDFDLVALAGTTVLLVAVAGVRLAARLGVPSLLLYLGLGLVLGEDVIGIHFDNAEVARNLGLVALALILAEGGLTSRWSDIRPVMPVAVLLATVGTAVSIGLTTLAAAAVFAGDWHTAALVATALAPTDAAAVFATVRGLRLPTRLVGTLEAESGLNDAPAVIVVTLLSSTHGHGVGHVAAVLGYELAGGAAIGVGIGWAAAAGLRRAALPAVGLYPIATLSVAVASYAAAASAHTSGFLAVYLTALWLGNAHLPHRRSTLGFADGIAWLAQIGLFVMLGLLASPSRLGAAVLPALAIGAALVIVARPLAVLASALPFRFSWREQLFLSSAGLRGAVPIVLATIPLTAGVPHAHRVFDVVFVLVALFTLVQAPQLAPLAAWLQLDDESRGYGLDVDAAPLDRMDADLLTVHVLQGSRLHRVEVWELDLPPTASLVYVIRESVGIVPDETTSLRQGDDLLLIVPRAVREQTQQRLRAVSRSGRLARFYGDSGR